uniref:Putative secreted protein n=1 Tax=Ixodes ricinus TaxID=34613 RepID=A0A6B0URV1_IXORI
MSAQRALLLFSLAAWPPCHRLSTAAFPWPWELRPHHPHCHLHQSLHHPHRLRRHSPPGPLSLGELASAWTCSLRLPIGALHRHFLLHCLHHPPHHRGCPLRPTRLHHPSPHRQAQGRLHRNLAQLLEPWLLSV